ncbi:MAG: hypothetical protein ACYC1L_02345 [Alphaproteobacteria bacterium]
MPRLVLVSLGTLNGAILEAVARSGVFDEIIVASRNADHGRRKVNTARVGAAVVGRFPKIEFVPFDFNGANAGEALKRLGADVVVTAPSLLPWWAVDKLSGEKGEVARAAPFATFVACHVAPMLAFRRAWVQARPHAAWINVSYPDGVNAVLTRTGAGPLCGIGNVEEAVPKARFAVAEALGAPPDEVEVRLVAPHALEYFLYAAETAAELPPCLVKATWRGRDVSAEARAGLFKPMPILYDMDFNLLTQASAVRFLTAFMARENSLVHVPGPDGRVGGYPIRAGGRRIALDLPPEWSEAQAIAMNEKALHWDGIAGITGDGIIQFTDKTAAALRVLLGRSVYQLSPHEASVMANELLAAVGVKKS